MKNNQKEINPDLEMYSYSELWEGLKLKYLNDHNGDFYKTDFDTMRTLYTHNVISDGTAFTWLNLNGYDEKFWKTFKECYKPKTSWMPHFRTPLIRKEK